MVNFGGGLFFENGGDPWIRRFSSVGGFNDERTGGSTFSGLQDTFVQGD